MALFPTFLTIVSTAWKVIKPFISTSKKTIDVIDTATTLIEKRTSSLTKYVFVITLGYLSVEQREALATIVSAFMENASSKDKILVALAVSIVMLFLRDILLSPYDSLKTAIQLLIKLLKKLLQFVICFFLFSFSKKVRKALFFKISKWWEYSVKVKELEACKQQIKVQSIEDKIKNTEKRIKSFKQK